jgi:large repetitive protein
VLSGGSASFTTTTLKVGTTTVTAVYGAGSIFSGSTSNMVTQVVNKYTSNTTVASSLNPSVYGQAVNLTSQVTSASPNQPTGTVTFKNGVSPLGTVPLVNGFALLTKKNLPAGTLSITATYNGDTANKKSTSPTLSQVVSQATTTTTVTSFPNPSVVGQSVVFKATVKSPTVIPVGTVTFTAGTTTLGQVSLSGGKASLTTSALPAGKTTVTATYNGTSNITGSSGSVVQTVN